MLGEGLRPVAFAEGEGRAQLGRVAGSSSGAVAQHFPITQPLTSQGLQPIASHTSATLIFHSRSGRESGRTDRLGPASGANMTPPKTILLKRAADTFCSL